MSQSDFLVEIGTEELPPKALTALSGAFGEEIVRGLKEARLGHGEVRLFATPRRLAVRVHQLDHQQPDANIERKGPAARAAFDQEGKPTKALIGFAQSCGTTPEALERIETPKGEWMIYRSIQPGKPARDLLPAIVINALNKLPIPKRMRWGARRAEFVRPVQWVVMLMDNEVIPCVILDRPAGNITRGHRFMAPAELVLNHPSEYESRLEQEGKVIVDFDQRKALIREGVNKMAGTVHGTAVIDENLLDEVTALNEWPVPLIGKFEERFLAVPPEALISSMKEHQKYFHVMDQEGKMLPYFITVSNIESRDPSQVIEGNEKVIRPRLSDAAFFFETDKKTTLESRVEKLKSIVFQEKLGTLYDKVQRVSRLAADIAEHIGGDPQLAKRAGFLAKSDLVSEMVLEFPELQGIIGYYYAKHDGEPIEVAQALNEQYMPRFSGDHLPESKTGCALAIAEKMDTIVGIFGINQPPTGTKDPFALRRAALGVLRIMVEKELDLDLKQVIARAAEEHGNLPSDTVRETVFEYMLERFRAWYEEKQIPVTVYHAVHAKRPSRPLDFHRRVLAVHEFTRLPEAETLSAANKRVSNILNKQAANDIAWAIRHELLTEDAEVELAEALSSLDKEISPLLDQHNYTAAMQSLAKLKAPVDRFFDEVMVMTDDEATRNNRLALLAELHQMFTRVADISLLQAG